MRILNRAVVAAALAVSAVVALAAPAQAETINYAWASSNGTVDVTGQLRTVFTYDGAGDTATFRFYNDVGTTGDGALTEIYFNSSLDDYLDFANTGNSEIADSGSGVNFAYPTNNLHVGGDIAWTAGWGMDSEPPPVASGLDVQDEWVEVTFDLLNNVSESTLLAAVRDGGLGLHVQSIGSESEWFESTTTVVPEPTSIALVALGLTGLLYHRRRRPVIQSE